MLLLHCHIKAGAKSEEIQNVPGGRLKIRLRAPAIEGRANKALVDFLARQFAVSKRDIQLVRGESSRYKSLAINKPGRLPPALAFKAPWRR